MEHSPSIWTSPQRLRALLPAPCSLPRAPPGQLPGHAEDCTTAAVARLSPGGHPPPAVLATSTLAAGGRSLLTPPEPAAASAQPGTRLGTNPPGHEQPSSVAHAAVSEPSSCAHVPSVKATADLVIGTAHRIPDGPGDRGQKWALGRGIAGRPSGTRPGFMPLAGSQVPSRQQLHTAGA